MFLTMARSGSIVELNSRQGKLHFQAPLTTIHAILVEFVT